MGPIALFDKSFLQGLSVDESVWFDQHFIPVICPVFYVETLADLAKAPSERGPAESEVRVIASKFPEMSGTPCANHMNLVMNELLSGHRAPFTGQIPVAGGRNVRSGDRAGVAFEASPESEAFARWLKGSFLDVERQYARGWRKQLEALDLAQVARSFQKLGIDGSKLKTLDEVRDMARATVAATDKPFERLQFAVVTLGVPSDFHRQIIERWMNWGKPALMEYAPYAAFVLTIELFFQLALGANLISTERSSNRTDIAYLFYLPFCNVFISSDKLHRRCAPLFLRSDQTFVWGPDLKADLKCLNSHYSALPELEKEKGLFAFADKPPTEGDSLVATLWDTHLPSWRTRGDRVEIKDPDIERKIVQELSAFSKAPGLHADEIPREQNEENYTLSIERRMHKRKGSWWQLPKNLKVEEEPD